MINPVKFELGRYVEVLVNGQQSKARVFGFELGHWLDPQDWIYHVMIPEYPFDLKISQTNLENGVNIITNGCTAKVITCEKVKAK